MTRLALINTKDRTITTFDSKERDLADAFAATNRPRMEVDHGSIAPRFMIIVYEYGLFKGAHDEYFRLGRQLLNGNAILYHTDDFGETIDFPERVIEHWADGCPDVEFFSSIDAIEAAITSGRVERPTTRINDEIIWSWTGVIQ